MSLRNIEKESRIQQAPTMDATPLEVVNLDLHYHAPNKKKPMQLAYAEKLLLSLKTLVPDQIAQKIKFDDTTFRAEKVEFVLLEQEIAAGEDAEWNILDQSTFDCVVMMALDDFSDDNRISSMPSRIPPLVGTLV